MSPGLQAGIGFDAEGAVPVSPDILPYMALVRLKSSVRLPGASSRAADEQPCSIIRVCSSLIVGLVAAIDGAGSPGNGGHAADAASYY